MKAIESLIVTHQHGCEIQFMMYYYLHSKNQFFILKQIIVDQEIISFFTRFKAIIPLFLEIFPVPPSIWAPLLAHKQINDEAMRYKIFRHCSFETLGSNLFVGI